MVLKENNSSSKRRKIVIIALPILIASILLCYCCYRVFAHERMQTLEIERVKSQVLDLQKQLQVLRNNENIWLEQGINYFAIGNSITSHPQNDYWWNADIGMAASSEDKDFVHLLSSYLQSSKGQPIETVAYNFFVWETQYQDRAETLGLLDSYLCEEIDLITIQLSENVTDITSFESDCVELFTYVKNEAPNAQIIVIDDFWDSGDRAIMKKRAAEACGLDFVSLEEIKGKTEYQAGLGSVVYDKMGNEHIIEHSGVSRHPGDKGMEWIAKAIEEIVR